MSMLNASRLWLCPILNLAFAGMSAICSNSRNAQIRIRREGEKHAPQFLPLSSPPTKVSLVLIASLLVDMAGPCRIFAHFMAGAGETHCVR